MLKNYFKIAFRNLRKKPGTTLITGSGLILGIAAFIFILQYVAFEFSINSAHDNYENIYRVVAFDEEGEPQVMLPPGIADAFEENISGVEYGTRFPNGLCSGVVTVNADNDQEKAFRESDCKYADQDLFNVFSLGLISGEKNLAEPKTAMITENHALKYFGNTDVVGEKLKVSNQFGDTEYTIAGVLENPSSLTGLEFGLLYSFVTLENPANRSGNDWVDPTGLDNGFSVSFITLAPGIDQESVAASFNQLKKAIKPDDESVFHLQKLSDVHIAPSLSYNLPTNGSLSQVLLIFGIGILIMVIAWANYVNLSTAQSIERAKQVGIQKTVGASRIQLSFQFLMETFVFLLLGLVFALVLVESLQGFYNQLVGKELSLFILNRPEFWLSGLLFLIAGTISAGGYVAFIITSQKPKEILKGSKGNEGKGLFMRKSLVVFQFAISITLIVSTFVFQKQLGFMMNRDLGMNLENRLVINGPAVNPANVTDRAKAFKQELSSLSFIENLSGTNNVPGRGYNFNASGIVGSDPNPGDEKKSFGMLFIDGQFLETYEIALASGKNYDQRTIDLSWDTQEWIVNEQAVRQLGYENAENALGKQVIWGENSYEIIGVVKDYHHGSLKNQIDPMIFLPQNSSSYFTLTLNNENYSENLSQIRPIYQEFFPGNPFEYFFIETQYDDQYTAEIKFKNLFLTASVLAIFIACLGLFGLAAFIANSRTKEIGVRKVLGASVMDIMTLLSRDFTKLVLIGFAIATPVSWYAMSEWLKNFAYSTDIGIGIFIASGFLALAISLFAVGSRVFKAANTNPVESLKSE